jgi:hypothetical protein
VEQRWSFVICNFFQLDGIVLWKADRNDSSSLNIACCRSTIRRHHCRYLLTGQRVLFKTFPKFILSVHYPCGEPTILYSKSMWKGGVFTAVHVTCPKRGVFDCGPFGGPFCKCQGSDCLKIHTTDLPHASPFRDKNPIPLDGIYFRRFDRTEVSSAIRCT